MKVLIFNSIFTAGGISKIVADYTDNISSDINVELMTLKVIDDIYVKDNYKIHTIGKSKNVFKRIRNEYKIIKKEKYDVVHVNGDFSVRVIECISAKLAGVKRIIIHSHSSSIGTSKKLKKVFHKMLKKLFDFYATDYLACSNEAAKWMFSKKIYKNNKYKVINNGINLDLYKFNNEKRSKIRKKLYCENKLLIGFVGRIEYPKNPYFIAEVLKDMIEVNKNIKFLLIGTGSLYDSFMEKIRKYGIENYIINLTKINNVNDYYNAMDVLILPSIFEGFPIVAVEAQTNGLKVLLSDRITKDAKFNENVKYLSIDSTDNWIEEINKDCLYDREEGIKKLKENKFDIKDVVEELEKIYKGE